MSYQKIGQNLTRNSSVYLFLAMGQQNKSMDGSFNANLDHVENSSFFTICWPTVHCYRGNFGKNSAISGQILMENKTKIVILVNEHLVCCELNH